MTIWLWIKTHNTDVYAIEMNKVDVQFIDGKKPMKKMNLLWRDCRLRRKLWSNKIQP